MTKPISLRLPADISEELEKIANLIDRPKSYVIRKALENYLAEYVDYQIALDRLNDKDDAIISSDEMRAKFGL
ncbi:MAG: ribbon-helix-helix protein, CopG family [Candidatus Marinimicrobia bacterium]|nr:ribbon-helix-helix protein, CopG family [Candidatus Neomarinimicrobiota bacterium]